MNEHVGARPSAPGPRSREPAPDRRGLMFVLSSPSGAGKTTLARALLAADSAIERSVSVTTRLPRPSEIDGKDYRFVDDRRFDAMVRNNELLEWAVVFGNRYGTTRASVETILSRGHDVLFDIDWQGGRHLHQTSGRDLVSVFILPPSILELERRLRNRHQDCEAIMAHRMARAIDQVQHWTEYDFVIVNDEVSRSLDKLRLILGSERLRRSRQAWVAGFVRNLEQERS